MIRLVNQFDDPRSPGGVATPSCCGPACCSCCCCCLVTTLTSATFTGVHVHGTAEAHGVDRRRRSAVTVAAVVSIAVAWFGGGFLAAGVADWSGGDIWLPLTVAFSSVLWGAALLWLYRVAGARFVEAGRSAAVIVLVTIVFFTVEFLTFGFFLYGQLLALPVPILVGRHVYRRMRRNA